MQLTSCVRLHFARRKLHFSLQLRRYKTVVAFKGSPDTAHSAGETQVGTSAKTPQRQSRLHQQEASAWPAVDFPRLHSQVCTEKQRLYKETPFMQKRQHNWNFKCVAVPFSTCATARQPLHPDPTGRPFLANLP